MVIFLFMKKEKKGNNEYLDWYRTRISGALNSIGGTQKQEKIHIPQPALPTAGLRIDRGRGKKRIKTIVHIDD